MYLEFIPVAEASVSTLMKSINKVIINPIIFFLFALALAYFLYGVAKYLLNPDSEDIRKKSKSQMITGIFGLFIMVAVFGIMNLILNTVGEKRIQLDNTGDYIINEDGKELDFNKYQGELVSTNLTSTDGVDMKDHTRDFGLTNVEVEKPTDFDNSPFRVKYISSNLCWRQEVHQAQSTEYKALNKVKEDAKKRLHTGTGIDATPLNFGILTAYNPADKLYHSWMDARYPKSGGKNIDCVLFVDTVNTPELPLDDYVKSNPFSVPTSMSSGPSIFTNRYDSDLLFHRVKASGISPILQLAREIAIKNAYLLMGIELEDINSMTIVYPRAKILEEKYIVNPNTGNYEYWVAIESSRGQN